MDSWCLLKQHQKILKLVPGWVKMFQQKNPNALVAPRGAEKGSQMIHEYFEFVPKSSLLLRFDQV